MPRRRTGNVVTFVCDRPLCASAMASTDTQPPTGWRVSRHGYVVCSKHYAPRPLTGDPLDYWLTKKRDESE